MAVNTSPIFSLTLNNNWPAVITAANTAVDGTGTTSVIYTAGANGSLLQKIVMKALGTNVATVVRFFLNNGSSSATAANNMLIREYGLPSTSASNVAPIGPDFELPLNLAMKAGYTIIACIGTAVSAGIMVGGVGGDF